MEQLSRKTMACLRILHTRHEKGTLFRDSNHIFGVIVIDDKLFPERNGIIIYGPNNPENCQAFILGMKEVMARKKDSEMIVEWINLRNMMKIFQYQELLS
tara:strand:+ start:701 stop:1000 length:300 start_codon:yes stop_codon:yes gene_type:complete